VTTEEIARALGAIDLRQPVRQTLTPLARKARRELGTEIQRRRLAKGLTLAQAAFEVGGSMGMVQDAEAGVSGSRHFLTDLLDTLEPGQQARPQPAPPTHEIGGACGAA
jgi:hypothetical protein